MTLLLLFSVPRLLRHLPSRTTFSSGTHSLTPVCRWRHHERQTLSNAHRKYPHRGNRYQASKTDQIVSNLLPRSDLTRDNNKELHHPTVIAVQPLRLRFPRLLSPLLHNRKHRAPTCISPTTHTPNKGHGGPCPMPRHRPLPRMVVGRTLPVNPLCKEQPPHAPGVRQPVMSP